MLSNPLETYASFFGAAFVVAFLYYWLWLLHPLSVGVKQFQEKRYPEAAETFLKVLRRRPPTGVEADTRRRLADTLEVLGKAEEAAGERERAAAVIARNPLDAMTQQAQGDLLNRKHQYDEACVAYSAALTRTPALDRPGRALIMAKLAIAHYEAARPAETVRWAQSALASQPNSLTRLSMERMSGVGYADQGDLEQAEYHYRQALDLSQRSGSPQDIARDLGILAGIYQKRGQFEEAIATSHEARKMFADPTRLSFSMEAECLREMGRFDEARAVMDQRRRAPGFDQPWMECRMQALWALGSAWIETRADQPEAALVFLEQAHAGFVADTGKGSIWPPPPQGNDDKLLLWCDAVKSLALAQRGDLQAATLMCESVLDRLPRFAQDRATRLGVYNHLGRAAFVSGNMVECQEMFRDYLACRPNPLGLPLAHYWLGEAHLRSGEADAAREEFQQAIAPGIETLEARRAQARLDELGG